jgi:hypothetical protein
MGSEAPEDCYICKAALDEENDTGTCLPPKDCAAKLEKMQREADDAEAAYLKEQDRFEEEYDALVKQEREDMHAHGD